MSINGKTQNQKVIQKDVFKRMGTNSRGLDLNGPFFKKIEAQMSNEEWGYQAGMADGDGHFRQPNEMNKIGYELKLCDREPVQFLADLYGTSLSVITYPKNKNYQKAYRTMLYGQRALHFMTAVCPLLIEKRKPVTKLINQVAPDYHPPKIAMDLNSIGSQLGYIAGFFDSEGSVQCRKAYKKKNKEVYIQRWVNLYNTDPRPLKKIQRFLTTPPIKWDKKNVPILIDKKEKLMDLKKNGEPRKVLYQLRILVPHQLTFMALLNPLLKIKRKANKLDAFKTLRSIDIMIDSKKFPNYPIRPSKKKGLTQRIK